jgi:hypothetical protein
MKMLTRGKSENTPCSPWLCERKDGKTAPTERRPPNVAWGHRRIGVTGGVAKSFYSGRVAEF